MRRSPGKYAQYVGRVGALAVSLGVGLAIASSTGVAYASTDNESGSDAVSATTSKSSTTESTAKDADENSDADDDEPEDDPDEEELEKGEPDLDEEDLDDELDEQDLDEGEPELDDDDLGEGEAPSDEVPGGDEPQDLPAGPDDGPGAPPAVETPAPARSTEELDAEDAVDGGDVENRDLEVPPPPAAPQPEVVSLSSTTTTTTTATSGPEESVETVEIMNALVSNVVSPFSNPAAPAQAPWFDALLAWVRRQISHTFFNKTPVLNRPVETEQILASYWIDIDASDPNGDLLSYKIIQPSTGVVTRELISGKFIYTPFLPPVGDSRVDRIQIVVQDSTEHLSLLNVFHSLARAFGLAQPDDLVVNIDVVVNPLVEFRPGIAAAGLPFYGVGNDPVKVFSSVTITDGDSDELTEAVITVATAYKDGDTLAWDGAEGGPISATVSNNGRTLTLSGLASIAEYEAAIKLVTFATTKGGVARSVTVSVTDDRGLESLAPAFAIVTVTSFPPAIAAAGAPIYGLGNDPVKVFSSVTITDGDSDELSEAVVRVATAYKSGDTLAWGGAEGGPITAAVSEDGRTLTLSGLASIAEYEAAIKLVTFATTKSGITRSVTVSVTDDSGVDAIAPGFALVSVSSFAPTLAGAGVSWYTIGGSPVKVFSSISVNDVDSDELSEAVIRVVTAYKSGDTLGYATGGPGGITATVSEDGRTITLSGVASIADYEAAIKLVTFATTKSGITRGVQVQVTDDSGAASVVPASALVNVTGGFAPTLAGAGVSWYTIGGSPVKVFSSISVNDVDSDELSEAVIRVVTAYKSGDSLGWGGAEGGPITATVSEDGRTITLSGLASIADYEAAIKLVT
ncbi:hypothetical protein, partial [Mycolicibacterium sp.]|uniref:hypothetical protein n=2 Tax=Mycolicibacterium sp. TaxID=2320850 RepID=UPI003D0D618C